MVKTYAAKATKNGICIFANAAGLRVTAFRSQSVATPQQREKLIAHAAARHWDIDPAAVGISHSAGGAPTFDIRNIAAHASLASSNDLVLLGLAEQPIGVDIEQIGNAQEPPWNVLTPCEQKALLLIADPVARHLLFLRMWTIKEAAVKALGTGFSTPPEHVGVSFDTGRPAVHFSDDHTRASFVHCDTLDVDAVGYVLACVTL